MHGRRERGRRGVVLLMVLFFALLLVSSIATFLRRAAIDALVVRNLDAAARAEALARGGARLGTALLLQDLLDEQAQEFQVEGPTDAWAQTAELPFELAEEETLRLHVEDAGARLNLNALFDEGEARDEDQVEIFLTELLRKVIDEMPGRPEEKLYDAEELARNLIDWVDADDVRLRGGLEDDYYQQQSPRYRAANRPLLSVDELRLVEGFDGRLVEALEPYVDVFPLLGGDGVNPNTAPPWVLALLFHGVAGELALANKDEVGDLVKVRRESLLCAETSERCVGLREAAGVDPNTIFPPPSYRSDVFRIRAEATVGEVRRVLEVVVDRSDPVEPRRLAWRMR